jgi:predicted RNA binding protein YcfA (HicA-like mRNA interferase family)
MADFDRELIRRLEQAGCRFIRPGKGSHQIWYSPITSRNFAVPVGIVSRHTANGVLKDAGLPKQF